MGEIRRTLVLQIFIDKKYEETNIGMEKGTEEINVDVFQSIIGKSVVRYATVLSISMMF